MKLKFLGMGMTLASLFVGSSQADEAVKVDAALKPYGEVGGVSGNLNAVGSDTLVNLMSMWAGDFGKHYPSVKMQVEGKGSATAPPALIEGTSQLGPMSRTMKSSEVDQFEKKYGYKPLAVPVAIDALAVFVHKDNPVKGLNLKQVDAIFSSTRKRGGEEVATWGQLGLTGQWANTPVSIYGRNSASGTYAFFKEHVLSKGDYKTTVKEQPGSSSVVQGIASELAAVGYSGIGYKTAGVRIVPLASEGEKYIDGTLANCLDGSYPLARYLYIYVNKKPGQPLDKLTAEFLKLVLSKDGQEVVVKDGYYPLPAEAVAEALKSIQ